MAVGFVTSLRNTLMSAINTAVNAGSGAGKIRLYVASRPATGGTATTLLAELACADPFAPSPVAGVLTASAITDDASADSTGNPVWGRVLDSDDNVVCDFSAGISGSGSELIVAAATINAGTSVAIDSFVFTEGNP